MSENEIIQLFRETAEAQQCPQCGGALTGGYYNPEELAKGPSDGVIAVKVPVEVMEEQNLTDSSGMALYIECEAFGTQCSFREVFYRFYQEVKKRRKNK